MKNKKIIFIVVIFVLLTTIITFTLIQENTNLVNLSYNEIIEKIENKEDFVLCVSASKCVHCQDYKPKLKKVANDYDIIIYYTNTDSFTDEQYETFKKNFSFDGGTPTTIFFKNGEETTTANRIEGNVKIERIINKLKNNGFILE